MFGIEIDVCNHTTSRAPTKTHASTVSDASQLLFDPPLISATVEPSSPLVEV